MSDTALIITSTGALVAYFGLTYLTRRIAEKSRITSITAAKQLLVSKDTPDSVKKFLGNKDVLGTSSLAPWLVVAGLPFIAIGSLLSKRDDTMLEEVAGAGEETDRLFTTYLDASIRSSIFRSPLALIIAAIEIVFMMAILGTAQLFASQLHGGLKSVLTYLFIRIDDYDTRGLAGMHQHR